MVSIKILQTWENAVLPMVSHPSDRGSRRVSRQRSFSAGLVQCLVKEREYAIYYDKYFGITIHP